jgi:pimeloyl-ACP methyl ester carboxylesterase
MPTVDGLKIHSSETGSGQKTVMLVHGWTCDATIWAEQAPVLATKYRVLMFDLPGHGRSDLPRDGQFSLDLFARAVEAVRVEAQPDRLLLVGHSMGAPVIIRYAQLYPQHTSGLVFVDGLAGNLSSSSRGGGLGAKMAGPEGRKFRESIIRGMFCAATTPAIESKILDMMMSAPEVTAAGAMTATFDGSLQVDIIDLPVLGIYAEHSIAARRDYLEAHFPKLEYTQIAGGGHFLMLEKSEECNRLLLAFLAKQHC